jgi:Protein of unknown function (DUF3105)
VAKKARTPPPPRRVQAPQRRDGKGPRQPSDGITIPRNVLLGGGGAVVVVAVVAILFFALSGGKTASAANVKATMLAAGCTYQDKLPLPPRDESAGNGGNYHADVPTLTTPMKGLWSTFPPSGGGHYQLWAVWGFYTQPVNPRQVVHNMEHGAVVMWWGPKVPASTVAELRAFYNEKVSGGAGDGMFGTPLTSIAGKSLGDKIALTAWTSLPGTYYVKGDYGIGHVAICPNFNEHAFTVFRDAYRGKGPEGIPLSDDEPGMGP